MYPIYKFELSANGTTQQAFPIYPDSLSKDFEKESNQEFFRAKLTGNLTFEKADYDFIVSKDFETEFGLEIFISYDAGATWASYWTGTFWKTDCQFDADAGTVVAKVNVSDRYNDILAGLDKEFDLIELAPEIQPIKADKRPMIQIYVPGESAVGCFLSGMWWETDCEVVTNETKLQQDYHFYPMKKCRIINVSGTVSPAVPDVFTGNAPDESGGNYDYEYQNGDYRLTVHCEWDGEGYAWYWELSHEPDGTVMWEASGNDPDSWPIAPYSQALNPVAGTGATGLVYLDVHDVTVYGRYVTDVVSAGGTTTYELDPYNDMVADNRNYTRVIGYNVPSTVIFYDALSTTPTQWGIYQPGQYYVAPYSAILGIFEAFPVARSTWGRISIWFVASLNDWLLEQQWRKEFTLKDNYPISSVLSVLLGKVAPGLTHAATTDYSRFLYGTNPITNINQTLFITPKSNVIYAGYSQPAQKAPITLGTVLNMLRDCFRCYWWVDSSNRLRIEHIEYFRRGGRYSGLPVVGTDLTVQKVTRNGKTWAFGREQYQFDKPDMTARYQFGWMDDVTQLFEGYPIDIVSKYVNPDKIEQIDVAQFTSDIDYILLNPSEISKDGFVLLSAILDSGDYRLPYINFEINNTDHILQNAYVAFIFLQQYYLYDLPAWWYEINGNVDEAYGIKRLKTQTIRFPMLHDPDMLQLIKTNLGNGMIEKLSINLPSRTANATLRYDTE